MDLYLEHLLSVVIFTPLRGRAAAARARVPRPRGGARGAPRRERLRARRLPGRACRCGSRFDRGADGFQFVEQHAWIPSIGVQYFLGVDGISALLVLLTTLLGPIAILSSWNAVTERVRALLRLPAAAADRHDRRLLRARPVPVLRVLGGDAGPDVLPDRDLGRAAPALRGDQVLPVHARRLGGDAARDPGALLPRQGAAGARRRPAASTTPCGCGWAIPQRPRSSGCSWRSSWASRSRCRCSRSTPGCPTRTSRRRPPAR